MTNQNAYSIISILFSLFQALRWSTATGERAKEKKKKNDEGARSPALSFSPDYLRAWNSLYLIAP